MVRNHGFLINKRYEAAGSLTVGPILGTEVGFKEFFFEDPAVGAARQHREAMIDFLVHEQLCSTLKVLDKHHCGYRSDPPATDSIND